MVHVTSPRPFQKLFGIRGLAHTTIDLSTIHYEDMKDNTKYQKWDGLE